MGAVYPEEGDFLKTGFAAPFIAGVLPYLI
jgi:hypothetical protein